MAGRYLFTNHYSVIDFELHGFCDQSIEAYSASVYVRLCKNAIITTNLLTAKSKIVPCFLLSCFFLLVIKTLSVEVNITEFVCWSDSKVPFWWIKSVNKKWKVWVENSLTEIRENIEVDCWCYVPMNAIPQI